MEKIKNKLKEKRILVADGAWGTLLQSAGLESGVCPESWNLERHNTVLEVARAYTKLGIDIVETNSFGGSSLKLNAHGLGGKAYEINRTAATISKQACNPDQIVVASMGPTGKILMMDEVSPSQVYDAFTEQATAFQEGGADAVIIETMTDMEEAREAIKAVRNNTDLEIVCSFTFDQISSGEFRTMMGLAPVQVVKELIGMGVPIVGTNCGNGLEKMIPIVSEIHEAYPHVPVLVNANAGMPEVKGSTVIYPDTPEIMAGYVPAILKAGARIIGGCCGTTPKHIEAIQTHVYEYLNRT